jgi:hypothetical protein
MYKKFKMVKINITLYLEILILNSEMHLTPPCIILKHVPKEERNNKIGTNTMTSTSLKMFLFYEFI